MQRLLLLAIFWVSAWFVYAEPAAIPIKGDFTEKRLLVTQKDTLEYLDYKDLDIIFQQIIDSQYKNIVWKLKKEECTYGMQFTLHNKTDSLQQLCLELVSPYLVLYGLYYQDSLGYYVRVQDLNLNRNVLLAFPLKSKQKQTYTLLYATTPERRDYFNVILWAKEHRLFSYKDGKGKNRQGVFTCSKELACILVFCFFNIAIFILFLIQVFITKAPRQKKYLFYLLIYCVFLFLTMFTDLGLWKEIKIIRSLITSLHYNWFHKILAGEFLFLNTFMLIHLLQFYLDIKKNFRISYYKLTNLLKIVSVIGSIFLFLVMIFEGEPIPYIPTFTYLISIIISIIALFVVIFRFRIFPQKQATEKVESIAISIAIGLGAAWSFFIGLDRLVGDPFPQLNLEAFYYTYHSALSLMLIELLIGLILFGVILFRVLSIYNTGMAAANILFKAKSRTFLAGVELEKRISDYLHDDIAGISSMEIMSKLANLRNKSPEIKSEVEELMRNVTKLREKARDISHELSSTSLEQLGLSAAIIDLKSQLRKAAPHIQVHITQSIELKALTKIAKYALYNIIRSATANTIRHANAQNIWIDFVVNEENQFILSIKDDGKGFDINAKNTKKRNGIGIANMENAAIVLDNNNPDAFQIKSEKGQGTSIIVTLPLANIMKQGV